ncbi:hypothetical protein [Microcoleus sp. B13-B6]
MNRLSGLFHKKIHSLWNRPKSLLSENGARCEENQDLSRVKFLPVAKRSPHLNFSVAIA